jgi:hypothetical protein
MADLDSDGNVVYTGQVSYDARRNNSAHDIRRTVAPPPRVVATVNITSAGGFTGAASFFSTIGGDPVAGGGAVMLNSGVLLRTVQCHAANTILVGLSGAGLANSDCFLMEANDEIFLPVGRLDDISFKTIGTNGMTISALGE